MRLHRGDRVTHQGRTIDTSPEYGRLDDGDPRPPYQQIASRLRAAILTGVLQPGARLPSQHQLATNFGVARMTVQQALRILKEDTLIVARQGSGTYVRDQPRQTVAAAHQNVHTALADFNRLRDERDSYQPKSDWDTTVFAFDQGLAELGERLATAVKDLMAALGGDHTGSLPDAVSVGDRK